MHLSNLTLKPLALSVLALFLVSIAVIPLQALALSPATLTSQTTFTSLNTDRWSKVWTDDRSQAIVFNGSTQYLTAASNSVYDVTTQDFWMAGMFYRTSDSGAVEVIANKIDTFQTTGYLIRITSSDKLQAKLAAASSSVEVSSVASISTNTWYAWAASYDRDGNLALYLYNLSTGASESQTGNISALSGSATNANTFSVGIDSGAAASYFPGRMDMLIPPQIGSTLSQAQFLQLAAGNFNAVSYSNLYDFNASNANDIIGSNNLTENGSPTYTTSVSTITPITGTYFIDVNQGNFKSVLINSWGGTWRTTTATLSASTNPSAVSNIEYVSGVTRVYTAQQMSTTSLNQKIINVHTGGVISSVNGTLTTTISPSGDPIAVESTKNAVYYIVSGTASQNNLGAYRSARDLSSLTAINTAVGSEAPHIVKMQVSVNGAAIGNDILYAIALDSNGTVANLMKITSSTMTATGLTATAGSPTNLQLTNLSDKMIFRYTAGGTTSTFSITKSTDAVTSLYTKSWVTFTNQITDFDGTTLTYKTADKAYFASTDKALSYSGAGVLDNPDLMFAQTVTPGTSSIAGIASTFYRISDTLVVTGSGTTWTPKTVSGNTIEPVLYSEQLSIPLQANSTLWNDNVIVLTCDANYNLPNPIIAGDDSDCFLWKTYDVSGAAVARQLPYTRASDLVHAPDYSYYTFQLTAGNPTLYELTTIYNAKDVDTGDFDSSGQLQQRLLYQQCYTIQVSETSTGNVLQTGSVCAGDDTIKTLSLTGIVIPADWLSTTWSYTLQRYFNGTEITPPNPLVNATNNMVILTFQKNTNPYNATINIVDNIFDAPTINQTYTFTNVSGASVVNATGIGILSNMTLYISGIENGVNVFNLVSAGESFDFSDIFDTADWGLLFGLPAVFLFPFIAAAMFPKSIAYFGIIFAVAIIGILQLFGFIVLPPWFWVISMPIVALAILLGYKR